MIHNSWLFCMAGIAYLHIDMICGVYEYVDRFSVYFVGLFFLGGGG